jgi:putative polyhydroxyalkanoate system protein
MPKLTIEQKHSLEPAAVRERLDQLSAKLAEKYGIEATWKSDTEAEVKRRPGASGTIRCRPDCVTIHLDLSFVLAPMKERIENRIRSELAAALKSSAAT